MRKLHPLTLVALIAIAIFVFLRFWRLGFPGEMVFDEVYFPKMAHQYLTGENFFDIHPPLGKLIIALGELVFGNTTIGWRVMPLLAGLAMLPVGYWATYQIFQDRRAGLILALLLAIDGLFIVYSRTGLMDGFMILFGLASLGFCWQFRRRRLSGEVAWGSLILTGLFAGLALAVKWIGAGFLPVVAVTVFATLYWNKNRAFEFADFLVFLGSFIVLPVALYTLPFLANWQTDFWHQFFEWHRQSWQYNVNLEATHPYASKWWSWPFLIRPIWFYYKADLGKIIGVDAIGNPIVWWGSTLAVVYSGLVLIYVALVNRKKASEVIDRSFLVPMLFTVAGWATFYLPWVKIGRVLFLYHYFASYLFALILTAFWLSQAMATKRGQMVVAALLLIAIIVGLLFAPIWIAYPIPQEWFNRLMWFRSWI